MVTKFGLGVEIQSPTGLSGCLFVCLSVCLSVSSVRDTITKFSEHHPVVERETKFENGYIGLRGWWFNVSDSLHDE